MGFYAVGCNTGSKNKNHRATNLKPQKNIRHETHVQESIKLIMRRDRNEQLKDGLNQCVVIKINWDQPYCVVRGPSELCWMSKRV